MPPSTDRTHAIPEGTRGYETQDANARGVAAFLLGLGVTIVLVVLLCWGIFRLYGYIYAHPAPASPFAEGRQVPAGPNLQVNPVEDFRAYMQREQQALHTYGWQNRQAGTVRMPIDRGMDLLVQKGLPVAPPPDARSAPSGPLPNNPESLKTLSADRKGGTLQ
jgi:hypothetical protein